ncbi:MAG: hypothetical protein QM767_05215 [Anaeromyxobacter sp.]
MPLRIGPKPPPAPAGATLTVVVDFAVQPFSIGDLLVYLNGALAAAESCGADRIDCCLLSDPDDPRSDPIMAALATRDTHRQRLFELLPLVQLCPRLGAVHVFDRREECLAHLDARAGSPVWPPRAAIEARRYMYYDILQAVHRHHQAGRPIPRLCFSEATAAWARRFLAEQAPGLVPITVNLRGNRRFHDHRNSDLAAWRALFVSCEPLPVRFFVTCAAAEVDDALRRCTNVVYAKDAHTDVIQDLALIRHSAFHVGASSGPASIPIFDERPYYICNADVLPHLPLYGGALVRSGEAEVRFAWASPLQRLGVVPETPALLIEQFQRIWRSRDWAAAQAAPPAR